jgi:hypothetical protein
MAIVATLLAGLSSSEMTKAQYYRSVAGQNQSKVGDQWGFFQAKRIRGTAMEMGIDLLPAYARPGPVYPYMILAPAEELVQLLTDAQAKVKLLKSGDKALASQAETFLKQSDAMQLDDPKDKQPPVKLADYLKRLEGDLDKNKEAFEYLGTGKLPKPDSLPMQDPKFKDSVEDPNVQETISAIKKRKPDSEIAPTVRKIKPETVRTAIEAAELQGTAYEKASEPIEDKIAALDRTLSGPLRLAAQYHYLALTAKSALKKAGTGASDELKSSIKAVADLDSQIQSAADELANLFKSAKHDYTARRYRNESKNNQATVMMYEVQVHRSDATSDSHRNRSAYFFYGMLGAQCGVAIGSIALAGRRKGLLWALATTAGVLAAGLGTYVYLTM